MNGNGCAGSIASGVSNGKTCVEEVLFQPVAFRLLEIIRLQPGQRWPMQQARARNSEPTFLLVLSELRNRLSDASQLFGRRQTIRTLQSECLRAVGP